MNYATQRWLGVRVRLLPLLRRLGLGLVLALLVASAGANDWRSALATVGGLSALLMTPLLVADQLTDALRWCLQALLLATAWMGALQAWLLPRTWLTMERQLPLTMRHTLPSDLQVCAVALLPWLGFGLLGLLSVGLSGDGPHARRALPAVGLLLLVTLVAIGLGGALLQWRRREAWRGMLHQLLQRLGRPRAAPVDAWRGAPAAWPTALLVLPLLRGAWPRSARALAGYAALLLAPPVLAGTWPAGALWLLLAFVPFCLLAVAHLAALLRAEGEALSPALAPLPLQLRPWRSARQAVALLPPVLGALAWAIAPLSWRANPALAAVSLLLIGGAWLAMQPLRRDDDAAVRLLLLLFFGLALASQSLT